MFCLFFYPIWRIMARCRWSCWAQKWILSENLVLFVNSINTRTYTQIHTPTVVQGGGEVDKTPPHHFMGGGAAGGLSRHQQWSTSWIISRIRNPVKTARNWYFFGARTFKIIHKKALCIVLSTTFTFIVERCWKNMHFHSKMAWSPATYDVISRHIS